MVFEKLVLRKMKFCALNIICDGHTEAIYACISMKFSHYVTLYISFFAISYLHNGEGRDYTSDFIIRLGEGKYLILETKGYDELRDVKKAVALRWVVEAIDR